MKNLRNHLKNNVEYQFSPPKFIMDLEKFEGSLMEAKNHRGHRLAT
jgi:hypothetical protein